MKNALMAALVLFLALPQVTSAQAKPDFSGHLDVRRGQERPGAGTRGWRRWRRRARRRPHGRRSSDCIDHQADGRRADAWIGRRPRARRRLSTSSTAARARTPSAWARRHRKPVWDGSKIVIATTQTVQGRGGEITIDSKDIYSVDGKTLTIETTRNTPAGDQTRKLIYTKS